MTRRAAARNPQGDPQGDPPGDAQGEPHGEPQRDPRRFFPPSYRASRARFVAALAAAGWEHEAHPVPGLGPAGEALSIDVGLRRGASGRALAISSGLHGVEGYFGAAVQLALLADPAWRAAAEASGATIVMIHALNPCGMAWVRRWNEDNVDLNRSFTPPDAPRPDTPEEYRLLAGFLNPPSPPPRLDLSLASIAALVARHGFDTLKTTLPVGQYDHPKGLFFGGHGPSATQRILSANLARWIGDAGETLHVDLHTGLGRWGRYALLTHPEPEGAEREALERRFGAVFQLQGERAVYKPRGMLAEWAPGQTPGRPYRVLTAEFGTHSNIRVLQALRAENRAHFWGRPESRHAWTKTALMEAFVPRDPGWRRMALAGGTAVCAAALG